LRFTRDSLDSLLKLSVQEHSVADFVPLVQTVKDFFSELVHMMSRLHEEDFPKNAQVLHQLAVLLKLGNEEAAG
jgi:hypothetical protein